MEAATPCLLLRLNVSYLIAMALQVPKGLDHMLLPTFLDLAWPILAILGGILIVALIIWLVHVLIRRTSPRAQDRERPDVS